MALSFTNINVSTAAVANRYVVSTNMKVGAYTLANTTPAWNGAGLVTITHTSVTGTDTLGTVAVVGIDLTGATRTDTITPIADSTATGTIPFRTITSITGAGWVINTGNDTIVVGVAGGAIVCGSTGLFAGVVVNTTQAAAVTIGDQSRTIATLKASIAEGNYMYGMPGVVFGGYLKVTTSSTNDLTIIHTSTLPTTYAL
jgi:hypothetical protein